MSAKDVHALHTTLRILGLSTCDASHLSAISRPGSPVIFVVSEPLETAAGLAGDDRRGAPHALALWERFHRTALADLRGLPVFVTTRTSVTSDPDRRREISVMGEG